MRGKDSQHGSDVGDRTSGSIPDRRAPGQLRRFSATRAFQWWSHTYGAGMRKREPKSEMGFRGDGQPDRDQPAPTGGKPRGAAVSKDQTAQESSEGSGRGGASLGRSCLVPAHQAGGLSRAAGPAAKSFVDARVNAAVALVHRD